MESFGDIFKINPLSYRRFIEIFSHFLPLLMCLAFLEFVIFLSGRLLFATHFRLFALLLFLLYLSSGCALGPIDVQQIPLFFQCGTTTVAGNPCNPKIYFALQNLILIKNIEGSVSILESKSITKFFTPLLEARILS